NFARMDSLIGQGCQERSPLRREGARQKQDGRRISSRRVEHDVVNIGRDRGIERAENPPQALASIVDGSTGTEEGPQEGIESSGSGRGNDSRELSEIHHLLPEVVAGGEEVRQVQDVPP